MLYKGYICQLVTLKAEVNSALNSCIDKENIHIFSRFNHAGNWLLVEHITNKNHQYSIE